MNKLSKHITLVETALGSLAAARNELPEGHPRRGCATFLNATFKVEELLAELRRYEAELEALL